MNHDEPAHGLWSLVILNSAVFLTFAFGFSRPRTPRFIPSLRSSGAAGERRG